jgi:DNA-binding beta-propeller fold protein YncE
MTEGASLRGGWSLTLLLMVGACGGAGEGADSGGDSAGVAGGQTRSGPEAPGAPVVFWVDSQGEVSRILSMVPGGADSEGEPPRIRLDPAPAGGRGLAFDPVEGLFYWAGRDAGVIQRGDLAGGTVETVLASGLDSIYAVAVDPEGRQLYWSDYGRGVIGRSELDGSGARSIVQGLEGPRGIALDGAGGWVYWVDRGTRRLERSRLDGSGRETVVEEGLEVPYGVAIDPRDGSLYVADAGPGSIFRVPSDGAAPLPFLANAGPHPSLMAVDDVERQLYWTDNRDNVVRRISLDTPGFPETLVEGQAGPRGIVLLRRAGVGIRGAGGPSQSSGVPQ